MSSNYLLVLAALILLFLYFRRVVIAHKYPHLGPVPFSQLDELLQVFFRYGPNGGYFVITLDARPERVLQFFKYIENSTIRYVIDFPVSPTTRAFYPELLKRVTKMHYLVTEHPLDPEDSKSPVEFIANVDCGNDTSKLLEFIKAILVDVYQAKDGDTFDVHFVRSLT
jgi:hypothetical protein